LKGSFVLVLHPHGFLKAKAISPLDDVARHNFSSVLQFC